MTEPVSGGHGNVDKEKSRSILANGLLLASTVILVILIGEIGVRA